MSNIKPMQVSIEWLLALDDNVLSEAYDAPADEVRAALQERLDRGQKFLPDDPST